jgi:uncharacterized membrane protein YkvA (DUF1232 family)
MEKMKRVACAVGWFLVEFALATHRIVVAIVAGFFSALWRMFLRPVGKIVIVHLVVSYVLYEQDFWPDVNYRGYVDDFALTTFFLRAIVPAPSRKKKRKPAPIVPAALARRDNLPVAAGGMGGIVLNGEAK